MAKKKKKKTNRGRPKLSKNPQSRSIQLDKTEWARIEKAVPEVSWAAKIRTLMTRLGI